MLISQEQIEKYLRLGNNTNGTTDLSNKKHGSKNHFSYPLILDTSALTKPVTQIVYFRHTRYAVHESAGKDL